MLGKPQQALHLVINPKTISHSCSSPLYSSVCDVLIEKFQEKSSHLRMSPNFLSQQVRNSRFLFPLVLHGNRGVFENARSHQSVWICYKHLSLGDC